MQLLRRQLQLLQLLLALMLLPLPLWAGSLQQEAIQLGQRALEVLLER